MFCICTAAQSALAANDNRSPLRSSAQLTRGRCDKTCAESFPTGRQSPPAVSNVGSALLTTREQLYTIVRSSSGTLETVGRCIWLTARLSRWSGVDMTTSAGAVGTSDVPSGAALAVGETVRMIGNSPTGDTINFEASPGLQILTNGTGANHAGANVNLLAFRTCP